MRNTRNIIRTLAILLSVAALASACQKENPVDGFRKAMVTLDISSLPMTKATEAATAEESKIHSIRVYAFTGNRQVGYFYKSMASPVTSFSLAIDIDVVGADVIENNTQDVEFYVIANEDAMNLVSGSPSLSEKVEKADLWGIRYSEIDKTKGIPMYYTGVHAVNLSGDTPLAPSPNTDMSGHDGHQIFQKLDVSLVRPVAKMEVYAAKESAASSLSVNSVIMTNPATLGYLLPPAVLSDVPLGSTPISILDTDTEVTKVLDPTASGVNLGEHTNYQKIGTSYYLLENPDGSEVWNVQNSVRASVMYFDYSEDGHADQGVAYLPPLLRNRSYKICCLIRSDREVIVRFEVSNWIDEIVNLPEYN